MSKQIDISTPAFQRAVAAFEERAGPLENQHALVAAIIEYHKAVQDALTEEARLDHERTKIAIMRASMRGQAAQSAANYPNASGVER